VIPDLRDTILNTWRTNNRVTVFLVEHLPPALWSSAVPGAPRRTIRMIAGHLHNARCMWIKTLGQELGVTVPRSVDRRRVGHKELVPALERSSRGILRLLTLGCEQGGKIPTASTYTWRNLPLDVGHVLGYFVAHESHHRGQIVVVARAWVIDFRRRSRVACASGRSVRRRPALTSKDRRVVRTQLSHRTWCAVR
jgi:uncharacterized damage-inducible protein DinB